MIITNIEEIKPVQSSKKIAYKIYIDDAYAFLLYKQDLMEYQLETGVELTTQQYDKIIESTVYRRAKQKAMAILKYMDRTEQELYFKLKEAYYTDDIINKTIDYLKSYRYIDDERYASSYINGRKNTLSLVNIRAKLIQKGINKELLEKIIAIEYNVDDEEKDPEIEAINRAIRKKLIDISKLNYEDKQKLMAHLYRKGFNMDKISKCINKIFK
jgi:regulatory protein